MMPQQKQLNLLGLATRSRNLVSGDEMVEKAIKQHKVYLVVVASDASDATLDRYTGICERENVALNTDFTRIEISHAIGKSRTICAISNRGMSEKFLSYVTGENNMNDK